MIPDAREQRAVFLREIKDHPNDDTPRLILADWLQDQGEARGELVFSQVHRRRLAEDDPQRVALQLRERQILKRYVFTWLGPLVDLASAWTFQRGLLRLEMRGDRFLQLKDDDATQEAFAWVEDLSLHGVVPQQLPQILASEFLQEVIGLDLSENRLGDDGMTPFVDAPLGHLRSLTLAGNRIGQRGIATLAQCGWLVGLRHLDVSSNRIADGGRVLAECPLLENLACLDVRENRLTIESVASLRERFGAKVRLGS